MKLWIIGLLASVCAQGADRTFVFKNQCKEPVWIGALGAAGKPIPLQGGWKLDPGASNQVSIPDSWSGRFWGRTNCSTTGTCATGDCGNKLQCSGAGGKPPASLAEFTLNGAGNQDFYDVSLVDGYNLPISITPTGGKKQGSDVYQCGAPSCVKDLNLTCPSVLQKKDSKGKVIACLSACEKFNTDQYCCRGAYGTPDKCPATQYSKVFKDACPTAYSYAYDDKTSTFLCTTPSQYTINFCPTASDTTNPAPSVTVTGTLPSDFVEIKTAKNSNLCLDVRAASAADGAIAQLYQCNGSDAQKWKLTQEGYIQSKLGKCLSNSANRVVNGNKLNLWNCHMGPDQLWNVNANRTVQLKNTNMCMDVTEGQFVNGTQLQIWECNPNNFNQLWAIPTSSTPPPNPSPTPTVSPTSPVGYKLVWEDNFTTFDRNKWNVEVNGSGMGNNELQFYIDAPRVIYSENGNLILQANKENYSGKAYTSGRINTKNKFSFKFGRMDVRAKLPIGQGLWPAIWLLPEYNKYGGWPLSGEIDVMEYKGQEPRRTHATIHFGDPWPRNKHVGTTWDLPAGTPNFHDEYHIFTMIWEQDKIQWLVDEKLIQTLTPANLPTCDNGQRCPWVFNEPFHIILNNAVGGNFLGSPDATTQFPQKFLIDYVRVFQK